MGNKITVELADTDIIFIYGCFQKKLAEIDKISTSPNCPFDKTTISNQKAPYLSVVEKLSLQVTDLIKWINFFNHAPFNLQGRSAICETLHLLE